MPLYDFKCSEGHRFERLVKLADFNQLQHCACTSPAERVISAPMISSVSYDYECPITGAPITSKLAHEDNLRKHGCRLHEPGETQGAIRAREAADNAFESAVGETIERTLDSWSGDKIEQLGKELSSGVDADIVRGTAQ